MTKPYKLQGVGHLTDGEIKRELETATGDRLAALEAERDDRKEYRARWNPDLSVGWKGAWRTRHSAPTQPTEVRP
jgi:hypothetical protein